MQDGVMEKLEIDGYVVFVRFDFITMLLSTRAKDFGYVIALSVS